MLSSAVGGSKAQRRHCKAQSSHPAQELVMKARFQGVLVSEFYET